MQEQYWRRAEGGCVCVCVCVCACACVCMLVGGV